MRLTLTITMTAFATLFGFPASPHAVTPGTNTVEAAIRADWTRQETALNCVAGSPESIRAAIARGRALAEDMKKIGKTQAAELCLKRLADAETEISRTVTPEVTAKDGRHLIRAVICGAGAPLDSGRVRGRDYALTEPTVWKETGQTTLLTSLSWDQTEVIYRFAGLNPAARYRLRAVYGAHGARTLRLAVGGQVLHDVQMPDDVAVERTSEIPASAITNQTVDIHITNIEGANAIISALELWSSEAETDPAALRRLSACHERTAPVSGNSPLYFLVRQSIRELMFAHPSLDFDELLFVKRHWPQIGHQCAHRVGEAQTPGADLCVLKGLSPDGQVLGLLPPELSATCGIGRPSLSFDGRQIVFPLARPRTPPTGYPIGISRYDHNNPADSHHYRGGACQMYDIYEIQTDGTGFRQLTHDTKAENTEPCHLPDGRIVFTSSRDGRMVQCGDWALVFGMFTMNPDGSDVRSFTQPQDSEFYPSVLDDGRILFTRWDYVMKPYNVIQQLWTVHPDGTHTQLAYGDWYSFSRGPIALFEARQIPGTTKVVATGAAHHNTCVGPIMIADLSQNRGGPGGLRNITTEVGYPECPPLTDERIDKSVADSPPMSNTRSPAGWYASPWPLAENLFLCCYSFSHDQAADTHGIYLIDTHGNKELVYRAAGASCYAPIPLKARPTPLKISTMLQPENLEMPGKLFVQNVNIGLEGVPPGTVKWLRVCETYPKMRHTTPQRVDVGVGSGWDMRGVLGVVPVEDDGSASFEIPPGKMIFLEALNKDFLEVRRMRNYINMQPGERQSCVGCHETPGTIGPSGARLQAALRAPSPITPPPWGAGPMRFNTVVQPVLDRNCIRCHGASPLTAGGGGGAKPDLRGGIMVSAPHAGDADQGPQHTVSTSFLALLKQVKYVTVTGHAGRKLPLKPYETGSAASPLMKMLQKGHKGVQLPAADWQALAAWIDCNAPYFGSYDDNVLEPVR